MKRIWKLLICTLMVASLVQPADAVQTCYEEGPRIVVAFGTPPDRKPILNRREMRAKTAKLRNRADALFTEASGYRIRWACGPPVELPLTPVSEADDNGTWYSRGTVEQDQAAAGLATEDVNLILIYNSTTAFEDARGAGMSMRSNDSSPGPDNENNIGPRTSYITQYPGNPWRARTVIHELLHSMGALQVDAPNIDETDAHCNDGPDFMCWWIGRRPLHVDYGGDDYFNPHPEPGSYLDTHFNIATDSVWINS